MYNWVGIHTECYHRHLNKEKFSTLLVVADEKGVQRALPVPSIILEDCTDETPDDERYIVFESKEPAPKKVIMKATDWERILNHNEELEKFIHEQKITSTDETSE